MVDRQRLTQVGRALRELGVAMIPAYSPQARGRSERNFGTWQRRLPQELRLRGIITREEANRFLRESYVAEFNRKFAVRAAQPESAFVPASGKELERIFSLQHERVVNGDNTISFANRVLQIERTRWRGTLAGCRVLVWQQLAGLLSVYYGPHRVGLFPHQEQEPESCGKTLRLGIPQKTQDSHFPTAPTTVFPSRFRGRKNQRQADTTPWVLGGDSEGVRHACCICSLAATRMVQHAISIENHNNCGYCPYSSFACLRFCSLAGSRNTRQEIWRRHDKHHQGFPS